MTFEFIDNITRADIAIRAYGETLEGLFSSAANGLLSTMVEKYDLLTRKVIKEVSLDSTEIDMLLFNFLDEFLYYKDSENLFLLTEDIKIFQKNDKYVLHAKISGEEIDAKKHSINIDVKAVTMHNFSVEKKGNKWTALFVLDV